MEKRLARWIARSDSYSGFADVLAAVLKQPECRQPFDGAGRARDKTNAGLDTVIGKLPNVQERAANIASSTAGSSPERDAHERDAHIWPVEGAAPPARGRIVNVIPQQ